MYFFQYWTHRTSHKGSYKRPLWSVSLSQKRPTEPLKVEAPPVLTSTELWRLRGPDLYSHLPGSKTDTSGNRSYKNVVNVTAEQQYERDVWLFSTSSSWVSYDDDERSRWKSVRGPFLSSCPSKTKLKRHVQYERYTFTSLSQVFDNHICRNVCLCTVYILGIKGISANLSIS